MARPKPTLPLQLARIDPSRTGVILRLEITQARTLIRLPSTPGPVGDAARRGRGAVSPWRGEKPCGRRGERRRRRPRAFPLASSRPPCSEERPAPSVVACRSSTGEHMRDRARVLAAGARGGSCGEAGNLRMKQRKLPRRPPHGPAQLDGAVAAPPATLGFVLCSGSGLAVAAWHGPPRASVAYGFSTGQCAPSIHSWVQSADAGVGRGAA